MIVWKPEGDICVVVCDMPPCQPSVDEPAMPGGPIPRYRTAVVKMCRIVVLTDNQGAYIERCVARQPVLEGGSDGAKTVGGDVRLEVWWRDWTKPRERLDMADEWSEKAILRRHLVSSNGGDLERSVERGYDNEVVLGEGGW